MFGSGKARSRSRLTHTLWVVHGWMPRRTVNHCIDKPMKNDEKCTDQASASKEKQLLSMKFADWCKLHQITIMNHNQSIYKVYKMQPRAKSCPASSAQYSQLSTLRQWLSNCIGTNFMPQGDALHRIADLWSKVVCLQSNRSQKNPKDMWTCPWVHLVALQTPDVCSWMLFCKRSCLVFAASIA